MNHAHGSRLCLAVLGLLLSFACQASGELSSEPAGRALRSPEPGWIRLEYEAKAMAGRVSTSLALADASFGELSAPPYQVLADAPAPLPAARILVLRVEGSAKALLGGYTSEGRIWFDAQTGAVLQRDKLRPGKKPYRKIYRFGGDGAFRVRLEPGNQAEAERSPERWTKIRETFYPYDRAGSGCAVVSEPTLLLYRAPLLDLETGGKAVSECVFLDDSLYRVRLEPQGRELRDVDYTVTAGGAERRVTGNREVVKVALRVEPLTQGAQRADFELLELRGDIAIYLDADSRVPVALSGERSGFGRMDIPLVRMQAP
jgi:hypothetical protein